MAKVQGTAVAQGVYKRIGNIVFRQTNAGTIAAQRPAKMTNPRTDAQMSQRIRLANLVAFYRASRDWMKKAFESKERKQSDYNAFVKANINSNPVALTKSEAASGACVLYPYRVSKGSLPPVTFVQTTDHHQSDIYIGDGGTYITTTATETIFVANCTVADFTNLLLQNNQNLREGDQLSLLIYRQGVNAIDSVPYVTCTKYEVILNAADGRLLSDFFPTLGDNLAISLTGDASNLALTIIDAAVGGFAMVVSRTEGSITRVSSSVLIVPEASNYSYYITAQHVAEAAASYGEQSEVFLDSTTEETPTADPLVQRAVLGFQLGADGGYYPVGSDTPDVIVADTQLRIRMAGTINLPETGTAVILYGWDGSAYTNLRSITSAQVTISGSEIIYTVSAQTTRIARIRVYYADGANAVGNFQVSVE